MQIRTIRPDDVDAVAALWVRAGLVASAEGRREEILTKLDRDPHLFVVAEVDGRLVGSVMGTWDGHRGWIKRVAVDPDWRRQGIGQAMVADVERRFWAMGVRHVRLAMWHTNERARAFWAALGWQEQPGVVYAGRDLAGDLAGDRADSGDRSDAC